MDILHLLCIVTLTGLTSGVDVLPDGPLIAAVGGKQTFTTTLTDGPFFLVQWRFGDSFIISATTVGNTTTPEYENRITFFPSTASLELRNLTADDSGQYRVTITSAEGVPQEGTTTLNVYEPISGVSVSPESTDLVEFNSSAHLVCSSSGSSPSFLWLNGSSEVTESDRVQITDGNTTLTIVNVTRYDEGPFSCRVSNPVSEGTSDAVHLSISYGPEYIILTVSPPEVYFAEGSNINLNCSAVSEPPAQYKWFLDGAELSHAEAELVLTKVQMSQSGNYSCQAFNHKTLRYVTSQSSSISVLARVANIMVTSNPTDLVEFNSSVRLSCSSSGSSLSFLWLNSSSEVTESDRVQITDGNTTLTIVNVTRYDEGPFSCRVSNPVSNGISDPINLSISYGPENLKLTLSPSQEYFGEGSNINLSCSAVSSPAALFNWFLNGGPLVDNGQVLRLMNIHLNQSGNYSCQAFNNKTLRYLTSQPSAVSVLGKISGASVTLSTNQAVEGNSVNLTCEASGSIFTRLWMKDGSVLTPDDNKTLSDNNRILSFNPVNKNDDGKYLCTISNPISSDGAQYNMVVNHGPEKAQITGESDIKVNRPIKLTCFAESTPLASYTWTLRRTDNGSEIVSKSAEYSKDKAELSDSGNYICEARNSITGRASSAELALSVTNSNPCSGGCIAGIVIACLVIVAGAVCGGYYMYKKKKFPKKSSKNEREGRDNAAHSSEELNYADLRFARNKNGVTVQSDLENNSSTYAEVRVNNRPTAASSPPTYDVHMQRIKRPAPQPGAQGASVYAQVRKN